MPHFSFSYISRIIEIFFLTSSVCLYSHSAHFPHMPHSHFSHMGPSLCLEVFCSHEPILPIWHTHPLSLYIIEIFFCSLEFQAPSGLVQLFISARDATLNRGGRGGGLLEEVRELRGYYADLYDEGRLEGG